MLNTLDERKRVILGAVVEQYVATGEPVSSAWVSETRDLGVRAATVRNEMSELEELGCLDHPHTSAGRVPTDRGYRLYVEGVMSDAESSADADLLPELTREHDAEPALATACRALARLTRYLSLAQPPQWGNEKLRNLQLVRLDAHRMLAVLVTESGRIHHALLEFDRLPRPGQLRALAAVINDQFVGTALGEITGGRLEQAVRDLWPQRSFAREALKVLGASMSFADDMPLLVEGGSQLLAMQEFQEAEVAHEVFALIEERSYLCQLLARQRPGLAATIGEEARHPAMRHCALMSATFEVPGGGMGCIGVLGPKRMRYRPVTSALLCAARNLRAVFAHQ
ncbi:MAG: heat-inducible transcription repressor HrcA [Armatimonadota bacterium]|nr:MAG: heat-inducible transcription repressor HrcA [Armatimonadota bacterium]